MFATESFVSAIRLLILVGRDHVSPRDALRPSLGRKHRPERTFVRVQAYQILETRIQFYHVRGRLGRLFVHLEARRICVVLRAGCEADAVALQRRTGCGA